MRYAVLSLFLITPQSIALCEPPRFTFAQEIQTGDADILPGGIVANGTDLFVVGFETRRVLKVSGAHTGTPTVGVLYRSSKSDTPAGPIEWGTNEGLVTVDFESPDLLLVAGDTFDDGAMLVLNANTGALIHQQAPNINAGNSLRVANAAFYGSKRIIAGYTAGSNYFEFDSKLKNPVFRNGPTPPASRDLLVGNGNTLYISFNTVDGQMGIHRWADDAVSPGSLAGNVSSPAWFTTTVPKSQQTVNGLARLEHGGVEYIILTDPSGARLIFVNSSDPAKTFELRDPSITQPRDVAVMSSANGRFLAITQSGNARVTIHGIDGAVLQQ